MLTLNAKDSPTDNNIYLVTLGETANSHIREPKTNFLLYETELISD